MGKVVIKKAPLCSEAFLYLEWESNPHTVVHEFESCASTNSAIQAAILGFVGANVKNNPEFL